jgi:hypothetical protein
MNLAGIEEKLFAAARRDAPGEHVPLAFEKRITARLASLPTLDRWAVWAQALWRAAAPCFVLMLVLCAWSLFAPQKPTSTSLSQDLESTLLATTDQDLAGDGSL